MSDDGDDDDDDDVLTLSPTLSNSLANNNNTTHSQLERHRESFSRSSRVRPHDVLLLSTKTSNVIKTIPVILITVLVATDSSELPPILKYR